MSLRWISTINKNLTKSSQTNAEARGALIMRPLYECQTKKLPQKSSGASE